MEIIVFFSFIFFSLFSILGFGKLFEFFFLEKSGNIKLGLTGIFGLFLLSSISYFTHFFTPHNYIHNSILIFIYLYFFFF